MAEKLFKDFAPSHGIPMQKDSAEGAKKLDKYAENGYESCALSQREEQDAFSFWWPLVKDCGIRVPETVIIKVPKELDEEGQKTFYRHFYMERPEDYPAIKKWVDDVVIPTLNASPLKGHLLFVKNSLYSNKFDARTCMPAPTPNALTDAIIGIQSTSCWTRASLRRMPKSRTSSGSSTWLLRSVPPTGRSAPRSWRWRRRLRRRTELWVSR